jgi:hypothetical protein
MIMRTILTVLIILTWLETLAQQPVVNRKEFQFKDASHTNTLIVANINGSVHVEGHPGEKVLVETKMQSGGESGITGDKDKEITVGYVELQDTLILYIEGLCSSFGRTRDRQHERHGGWGYDYTACNDGGWTKNDQDYEVNFVIRVPAKTNLILSTINKGDLTVTGHDGGVIAENINGNVKLDHITGATRATTINGDLTLNYDRNPGVDCRYYSLNGDIRADFRKGLAATLSFKSFNGDFYTNLDDLVSLPVSLEKTQDKEGVRYKLSGNRYSVREGDIHLNFETFNGNVYLREKEL